MRIIIDGDACPVVDITTNIAKQFNVELILYCDYNHDIDLDYGEVRKVDQSNQSVDMEILNNSKKGDIVVTNDYGLASLVLGKGVNAINGKGLIFNEKNIDPLLMQRHINTKIRRSGGKHPTFKKRNEKDDKMFKKKLKNLINN
ncbi:MAG: YaiI/YqxD family protein [Halanaerobiales bacterium]